MASLNKDKLVAEKRFEVELPEEALADLGWQETEVPRRLREMVVMELLRRDHLCEAQAASFLHLDRWDLLELMGHYQVPAIRLSPEALHQELLRVPSDPTRL